MSSYGDLADRLESVLADLDELAFDELREAVADGATIRPLSDKELAKARRAVEKATRVLEALDQRGEPAVAVVEFLKGVKTFGVIVDELGGYIGFVALV